MGSKDKVSSFKQSLICYTKSLIISKNPAMYPLPTINGGVLSALLKGPHWIRMHTNRYEHKTRRTNVRPAFLNLKHSDLNASQNLNSIQTGLNQSSTVTHGTGIQSWTEIQSRSKLNCSETDIESGHGLHVMQRFRWHP